MDAYNIVVPATSANLGPGFDAIGMALALHNQFAFRPTARGLTITVSGEGAATIPCDASNLVYRAAQTLFDELGFRPTGLQIDIRTAVPSSSGMGSSSTAIVGGLLGANALAGSPLSRAELLARATAIEGHPDNVMPALYGGLTIGVMDGGTVIVEQVALPPLRVVVVLPDVALSTEQARAALPPVVPLRDAIFNISRAALLVRALARGDYDKLRVAMQDRLHQPYRFPLIAGIAQAATQALAAGAAGVALSGAGPSLIAFAPDGHAAIGAAIQAAFDAAGVSSRVWHLDVDRAGARVEAADGRQVG